MDGSLPLARLLVAAVALIIAFGVGFARAAASAEQADPMADVRQSHPEMRATHGRIGMGTDGAEIDRMQAQMDEMHADMSVRLSPEDRVRHERMHEACSGLITERREG
jgi:hypothetical protein